MSIEAPSSAEHNGFSGGGLFGCSIPGSSLRPELQRVSLLLGETVLGALAQKRVTVIGLGGVGSWAAEALVRSGLLHITIVDNDTVCATNINRQIQALPGTVGQSKAEALKARLLAINPRCEVTAVNRIFSRETVAAAALLSGIESASYVIDAIDTLPNKLDLIEFVSGLRSAHAPGGALRPRLFSSMGMASRLDPTRLKTADIWDSSGCPLARLVRQGLRKRGFTGHFTVVYSDEPPCGRQEHFDDDTGCAGQGSSRKKINGSIVTVTAAAGMILASLVIRDLCNG
jgi:tRNA A37 threonylcarbamoyladenosine dehydratase